MVCEPGKLWESSKNVGVKKTQCGNAAGVWWIPGKDNGLAADCFQNESACSKHTLSSRRFCILY